MAYQKQEWVDKSSLITKKRLSHIENGIYDAHETISSLNNELTNYYKREQIEQLIQNLINRYKLTEPTLSSISANKTKTEYHIGEVISLSDITVFALYSNGATVVESDYNTNISDIDTSTVGIKTLMITCTVAEVVKTCNITLNITEIQPSETVYATFSYDATSITDIDTTIKASSYVVDIPQGTKLYAKWDSADYSGDNSFLEEVGVYLTFKDSLSTLLGSVPLFTRFDNEVLLLDRYTNADVLSTGVCTKIGVNFSISGTSTATLPASMNIINLRIYSKSNIPVDRNEEIQLGSPLVVSIGIFPDSYNTGVKGVLTDYRLTNSISESTTLVYNNANNIGTEGIVYEDILFDNITMYFNDNSISSVTFRNCKFDGKLQLSYAIQATVNVGRIVCENCEFIGYNSAVCNGTTPMTFDRCYVHHMGGDGFKGHPEHIFKNCYIASCGLNENAHADLIQITGYPTQDTRFEMENCRLENLGCLENNVANASIFFCMSNGNAIDCKLKDIYCNGGGYTVYYNSSNGYTINNSLIENIEIGCSYQFDKYSTELSEMISAIHPSDKLHVGSVWKENNQIKISVTNYVNSERTLTVKMLDGTVIGNYIIPKCYTYQEYYQNADINLNDIPSDYIVTIDSNANGIICYDGSETVRNVNSL